MAYTSPVDARAPVRAELRGAYRDDARYPAAIVNVTNRCNLHCEHCFVYRDGNPNEAPRRASDEIGDDALLATIEALRDRHGIASMLWMGGEPLLRRRLIARGVRLFARNTVTTNGTIPLPDLGRSVLYVVSLDGPEDLNDAIRGRGVYRRVMGRLASLPEGFSSPVQVQCVVTRRNWRRVAELVAAVEAHPRIGWMTFSFHVPGRDERGGDAWDDTAGREEAVHEALRLKAAHPATVRNSRLSLELMRPPECRRVTGDCPARRFVLPLYLERDRLVTPYCCYGNDVDCDRCGAWVVFHLAALERGGGAATLDPSSPVTVDA